MDMNVWYRGFIMCNLVVLCMYVFSYLPIFDERKLSQYWGQYRPLANKISPLLLNIDRKRKAASSRRNRVDQGIAVATSAAKQRTMYDPRKQQGIALNDFPLRYVRSNLEATRILKRHKKLSRRKLRIMKTALRQNTTVPVRFDDEDEPSLNENRRGRITVLFEGRMGNNLYQYSALYAAAVRHRMSIVLWKHCPVATVFKLNATLVDEEQPGQDWAPFIEWTPYDRRVMHLDSSRDIQMIGAYRSESYFQDVRDRLPYEYRFVDRVEETAYKYLQKVTRGLNWQTSVLIGVHIRRTDLISQFERANKQPAFTSAYLRTARLYMATQFASKTILFVVCSDDIRWAKAHFSAGGYGVVFSEGHDAAVDFAILSKTNHSIITIGTFGRWAAYLSGGTTVFYKYEFDNRHHNYENLLYTDAHWKGLSGREKIDK